MFLLSLLVGWPLGKLIAAPACVCFFFLQHERCCCRHCSHLTVTPLVPDNLPRSPPINRLAPPRLTLPLTSPPPTHCCPSLSLSSTLSSLEHMSIFFFFFPSTILSFTHPFLLCLSSISSPLSLAVWVFPVFHYAPFTHCALSLSLW